MKNFQKLLALAASLGVLCLSILLISVEAVQAESNPMAAMQAIVEKVDVMNGGFDVKVSTTIPAIPGNQSLRVGQAMVSLSPETMKEGTINSIKITGPNGIEFGCVNLKVKQGTDLIKSCGGPALLVAGETLYEAKGSNFGPNGTGTFSVNLIP